MEVRELITRLGFKTDQAGIAKAERGMAHLRGLALKLTGIFSAIAGAGGLIAIVKSTANAGDEAVKTSQKVGVSIKSYQRLAYAASLADLSQEQLASGLKLFSRNLVDASEGGKETSKTFKKLRINPKKMVGKTEETLIAIADQFAVMPDGAKKTALAMDLFGRSGAEMIPFLNAGGKEIKKLMDEAELFGVVLDDVTAKQGEEFNDQLTRMGTIFKGLKNIIGAELLPIFKDAIDRFIEWYKVNKDIVRGKVKGFVLGLISVGKKLADLMPEILAGLALIAAFKTGKAIYEIGEMIGSLKLLSREAQITSSSLAGIWFAAIAGGIQIGIKFRKEITGFFKDIGWESLVDGTMVKAFLSGLETVKMAFQTDWETIKNFVVQKIREMVQEVFILSNPIGALISQIDKVASSGPKGTFQNLSSAMQARPASSPVGGVRGGVGQSVANNQKTFNIRNDIKVSVGSGESAGQSIADQIAKQLDGQLRKTIAAFPS